MSFDLVAWLRGCALPLWSDIGVDAASGMFVERLDLDGHPVFNVPRRVLVQARQIYVFAEAYQRDWHPGAGKLAEQAGEAMVRVFRREDGGWIFSATPDARPHDDTSDLYAQAFVLFALASLTRLTGSKCWLKLAAATLAFLDARMATPATGGFAESHPVKPGPRRQNPHMHLLEALLALDDVSPGGAYRDRADALIDLFERRFLHGQNRVLVEFYDGDFKPLGAPVFAFEPGHHFEWAWLLAKHAALRGSQKPPRLGCHLYDIAWRFGFTPDDLVLYDEVAGDGCASVRSTRLWPCTEAIKAAALGFDNSSMTRRKARIDGLGDAMNQRFLVPAVRGGWIDHVDADGKPLAQFIPASSLYHLVGAACAQADLDQALLEERV